VTRLDVHGPTFREGPVMKGGINLEYQIHERPPDPPPMKPGALDAAAARCAGAGHPAGLAGGVCLDCLRVRHG
jgi:hypothetical protein